MRCPHGKIKRKLFAWRHSNGDVCPSMVEKSYEKSSEQWKPEGCIRPDKTVRVGDPEVLAYLVTQDGVLKYAEWMCGGCSKDGIAFPCSITHAEMFKRVVTLASSKPASSALESTMEGITNFAENMRFVRHRANIGAVDTWYARLVKPSVMKAMFSMPLLPAILTAQEVQAAVADLSAQHQDRLSRLRQSVAEVASGLR